MRKNVIVLAILFVAFFSSQSTMAGDKSYGVRAGWQSAMLKYSGGDSDNLSSYYLGGYLEHDVIPFLKFGYGLEYAQMGGKVEGFGDYKLGYLGVPLYLKAKVGPLYALAGSGINFKISETDVETKAKSTDVPVFAGIGVNFLMLSLEARYHWGMMEVQEDAKNAYLQVGLAVHF